MDKEFVAANGTEVVVDEECQVFGVTEEELAEADNPEDLTEGLKELAEEDGS